jgi:endonuclease/exonuclease/phosphatase (EEP) superfamily protein YafD
MLYQIILGVITLLLLAVSLLPFSRSNHWLIRVWEFPRIQLLFITVAVFVLNLLQVASPLSITVAIVLIGVFFYQCWWVYPYTVFAATQVENASSRSQRDSIKILTSNVLMTNRCADKLLELVTEYQPDVLVTLETDDWWQDSLKSLHCDYPYRVNKAQDNLYGMHVYSKYPLLDVEAIDLIEKDIPSVHCRLELSDSTLIKCHFLHPAPPSPTENETSTPRDRELLLIAKKVRDNDEPTIVTGDLNDVAWSATTRKFKQVSGLKDPRIGRGFFNTFHASIPLLRWPLDHIFHSDSFQLVKIKRLPSINSDHFPLFSELSYSNDKVLRKSKR